MLLSYNTWSMPEIAIEDAVAHCAVVGYDSMELTVCPGWPTDASQLDKRQRRDIRHLFDDNGILLAGFTGNAAVLEPERWAANKVSLQACFELAADLQQPAEKLAVSTTTGATGDIDLTVAFEKYKGLVVERFGELADSAGAAGVRVALEPHVLAVVREPAQARWVMDQVGGSSIGVNLDVSHFDVQGIRSEDVVNELAPFIISTEVKDQLGRYPNFSFLIPGEGSFDYVNFLQALAGIGFEGSVSVEVAKMRQAFAGYDPLKAATRSYEVLAAAFETAGVARRKR